MAATLISAVLGFLSDFFGRAVRDWLATREAAAARTDAAGAHARAAAAEAGAETQKTIAEIADERSRLDSPPDDAGDLARRLRERAAADRAAGRGDPAG
mgnify:CR=1 FL=1